METAAYTPNQRLLGKQSTDIVIIGGGFTGLSTAYYLKKLNPSVSVAIVESHFVGYGASGRNAGFSMTLFGFNLTYNRYRFGKQRTREAHRYMESAVDHTRQLVEQNQLECEFEFPGFLRVATTPQYRDRLRKEWKLIGDLGLTGFEWIEGPALREKVYSPHYQAAIAERRCGLLNPAKLAWGMKGLCEEQGVAVFEGSQVLKARLRPTVEVTTKDGTISAEKIMVATNAYSHFFPRLKRKQLPVATHIVLTRPLTDGELETIGWGQRQGIEDVRNLVHYYRLTKDNRILMGGGDVGLFYGYPTYPEPVDNMAIYNHLREHVEFLFPSLRGIEFTHRWGGVVSVPLDLAPVMGFIGDERCVFSLGCVGHGVALSLMNGQVAAHLLSETQSHLTDLFFINRRVIPWPPEPFRFGLSAGIKTLLDLEDRINERGMKKAH